MNISKLKVFNFSLIPVLLLATLFFISIAKSNDFDINYAKKMMNDIKHLRIAIDGYYLKTGTFPDLTMMSKESEKNDLTLIKYSFENGEEITFADIYGSETLISTPEYKDLAASNKVYEVNDFTNVTNDGGWNYNIKTGEIHINLPSNFFDQSIDWNSY